MSETRGREEQRCASLDEYLTWMGIENQPYLNALLFTHKDHNSRGFTNPKQTARLGGVEGS